MMETKKKTSNEDEKQPLKCWLVEITLTSGEDLQFYVTAKDKFMAYEKADAYAIMAENEDLKELIKGKGFRLLP
jgi:hypothetical protein